MATKLMNFIFTTRIGSYILITYLTLYFIAVFAVGIDHAAQRDIASHRIERLSQMSFLELGEVKTCGKTCS